MWCDELTSTGERRHPLFMQDGVEKGSEREPFRWVLMLMPRGRDALRRWV